MNRNTNYSKELSAYFEKRSLIPITPLYTLTRDQVVYPSMASLSFLRTTAIGMIKDSLNETTRRADDLRSNIVASGVPGYSVSAKNTGYSGIVIVYHNATGESVGGMGSNGTSAIKPEHQGKGLGAEILIHAFDTGVKKLHDRAFFSPSGYAARASAHRVAVRRALETGMSVDYKVLKDYPEFAEAYGIDLLKLAQEEKINKPYSLFSDTEITSSKPKQTQYESNVLPSLSDLCVKSGEYSDPIEFAEEMMATYTKDYMPSWSVTDSHGKIVYEGPAEMAEMFTPFREYNVVSMADTLNAEKTEKQNGIKQGLIAIWTQWQVDDERGFMAPKDLKGAFAHLANTLKASAYRLTNKDDAPPVFCGMPPCGPPLIEFLTPEGRFATKITFFRNRVGKPVSIEMDWLALKEENHDFQEKIINSLDQYCDKMNVEFIVHEKIEPDLNMENNTGYSS